MKQEFKDLLLQVAINRARKLNYEFTNITIDEINKLINTGVENMSDSEVRNAPSRQRAQDNLVKLINNMAKYATDNRINENLDLRTFSASKTSICPLWPFC